MQKTKNFFKLVWAMIIAAKGSPMVPAAYVTREHESNKQQEIAEKKKKLERKTVYPSQEKCFPQSSNIQNTPKVKQFR